MWFFFFSTNLLTLVVACDKGFPLNEHVHLPCGHNYHDFCFFVHMEGMEGGQAKCAEPSCGQDVHPH